MTPEEFAKAVSKVGPDGAAVVAEHYSDNDELLVHLVMSDVLRLCVQRFHTGGAVSAEPVLALVEQALLSGDERLENAVLVSFVEGAGYGKGETPEFLASWPTNLAEALGRYNE